MKTGATRDPHWHSRLTAVLQFSPHAQPHSTITVIDTLRFSRRFDRLAITTRLITSWKKFQRGRDQS